MIRKMVVAVLCLIAVPSFAQTIEHLAIASQFNNWRVAGSANLAVGANPQVAFTPCLVQGDPNHQIQAVSASTPILIKDPGNPSIDEVLTPTAIVVTSNGCTATLNTTNAHTTPWYIVSGSFGLQEAINATTQTGVMNAVELDSVWHNFGGGANTIYAAAGSPYMGVIDVTIAPNVAFRWSGTHYVASYSLNGITGLTLAAGAAAGSSPTVANTANSTGNIMTANVTTGTATTTGTLFTETNGTAFTGGVQNCTVQSVGVNNPPVYTVATTSTVLTVAVAVAPVVSTAYIFNIECN
jgi:Tfp pilus assembly protein FimT